MSFTIPSGNGRNTNCFACQSRTRSEWCELKDDDLALLNRAKTSNLYAPGQVIFYQGNPCLGIHCVEEGTVALRKTDGRGHSVISRLYHTGSTMGYLEYFAGDTYSGTAEALVPSRICFIDRAAVRRLLEHNPSLGFRFLRRLATDLRDAEQTKLDLVALPLRARLAHLLLVLKERFGEVDEQGILSIQLPISRQDIAALLGVRPESISRSIRQLEEDNVVRFHGRTVLVPDLDPLLDELEVDRAS